MLTKMYFDIPAVFTSTMEHKCEENTQRPLAKRRGHTGLNRKAMRRFRSKRKWLFYALIFVQEDGLLIIFIQVWHVRVSG